MNLKKLRQNIKKTQEEVANDLQIKKLTYQYYELGKRNPPIHLLIKLADYFNVTTDYLLERESSFINLDDLTLNQRDAIKLLLKLDDNNCSKALSYIQYIIEKQK